VKINTLPENLLRCCRSCETIEIIVFGIQKNRVSGWMLRRYVWGMVGISCSWFTIISMLPNRYNCNSSKNHMLVRTNEMLMQVFIVILEKQSWGGVFVTLWGRFVLAGTSWIQGKLSILKAKLWWRCWNKDILYVLSFIPGGDSRNVWELGQNFERNFINPTSE
jgi:hypothetical protein